MTMKVEIVKVSNMQASGQQYHCKQKCMKSLSIFKKETLLTNKGNIYDIN